MNQDATSTPHIRDVLISEADMELFVDANCLYKRKTYNDGDTVIDNCLICECINGEIKDCSTSVNCIDKKSPHVKENDITYKDEEVIESSNRKAVDIVKHSLNMRDNLIKVPEGQSNVIKVQINSSFQAGGIVSAQGGVNVDGAVAKTIVTEVGNSHEEKQGAAGTFGHEGGNKEKDWKVEIKIKENTSKGNKEQTPFEGKSCTFNKESVSDRQTIELESVTCICNDGALTCVKNEGTPGICSVTGYQMIRTFDGTLYETPGKCSYILAKTPAFTMTLNNKLCNELGKVDQDPEAVCIESVDIYIPSKASIKLLSDGTILSAGENTSLPYSILETITVLRSSSTFLDVVSPLFNLQYDSVGNRLYVILDPSYKGQTSGLCGTYNDNRNDDYRSSSDITETVSRLFSKSWRVTSHSCSEQEKGSENGDKKVEAVLICADALESSIFDDCARLIDTHSFKTSCANTVYYDNTFGLCSALADYAYRCAHHGIIVPVSSSFVDCTPVCDGEMILNTESVFSQQDCAEYSTTLLKISPSIPLNEACICPPDLYYDASENKCVPGDSCPCYSINRVFKLGETVTQANGDTCPCERVLLCGGTETPPEVVQCSENEVNADCLVGYGKTCEPSCQNLQVLDQNCALDCQPGCVCKFGLLRSNNGSCIPISECPCLHGDDVYNPGETLAQDCNTCTCEHGKFVCTNKQCNRVCNAYGESQFFLFDNIWKSFSTRQCPIVLAQSRQGESPSFNVVMQNLPNEVMGGALQKKIIKIHFGGASVVLSEFDPTVVHELGSTTQVRIYRSGFYVVAHFLEGLAVYYDQHLDVIIQLEPQLQGKVEGMCGDGDGTTSGELTISNMAQYASQYLVGECPDQETTPTPPTENQKKFVETQCNLLKSDEFAECHTVVNVESYYTACVEETEGCGEGEGFPCFCTSLAAYARACCRKGVTIEWRSPDICPSPCEYYNRDAGKGPYHLVMRNGKTLVANYDTKAVVVEFIEPGNLKASFMVTPSLYVDPLNGRKLVSLESAEHHNFFIVQNDDGSLSLKKWQPSMSFRISATFIQRPSRLVKEYDTLESYSARGNFLSFRSDRLFMSRVMSESIVQMNFKLTEESFGLPSFSICTWKYRACGSPCIPTCQDPLGTKCTLTLKVEGCYPICAPGKVFDEITHRCVQYDDCVTPPAETSTSPKTTPVVIPTTSPSEEKCKNVDCNVDFCKDGEYLQQVPSTDPCCLHYVCIGTTTPIPLITTTETCKGVTCNIEPCADGEYLQQVATTDPCCPHYECVECQVACEPPPTCVDGSPPVRLDDPDVECCPGYECRLETTIGPSVTSPQDECKNVVCPNPDCQGNVVFMEVPSDDPCCKHYNCVPFEPTPTPRKCKHIVCKEFECNMKGSVKVEVEGNDPCCPIYDCAPEITPSKGKCQHVECKEKKCLDGETLVQVEGNDPCCPLYDCVSTPVTTAPPTTPEVSPAFIFN
ncbi:otogelin-like protein [Mixophyes fleayi]|uniref:otogelin-like protein n=1 Tax=Mixophyes fleayi TaxID=3061075 RepID=UPI003F4DD685